MVHAYQHNVHGKLTSDRWATTLIDNFIEAAELQPDRYVPNGTTSSVICDVGLACTESKITGSVRGVDRENCASRRVERT